MKEIKNILVIGQCTLHWGRMEFGNIGNYYVIEPFFQKLRETFPNANICTTFQMSDEFQSMTGVSCLPMHYYYGWQDSDLSIAYKEYAIATIYHNTNSLVETTPYINSILDSDLVIDYSGDIWGMNADFVGKDRFLVGLLKDRTAQLLGKKVVMLAGSPGPFKRDAILPFAREVFEHFYYVSNREAISREVLTEYGFDVERVVNAACPAFLFEPCPQKDILPYLKGTPLENKNKPVIGFILCGWNMLKGPFNREDWSNEEFSQYVELLTYMIKKYDVEICLLSHSNGFELPPQFKHIHGRDYPLVKRLYEILRESDISNHVYLFDSIYSPKETKAIIANFDMLVSGRVHGAVAGLSQSIPTVIVDYGHEPKAHKLQGFAEVAGVKEFVVAPNDIWRMKEVVDKCWTQRKRIHEYLVERNQSIIKPLVLKQFEDLKKVMEH